jgi:hypothetical protein
LAGDMTLARDGSLYRLAASGDELVLIERALDGSTTEIPVPQTSGIVATGLQVAVDEATATTVVVWQEGEGEFAQVVLATHNAGTWFGPLAIAGSDGISAANPTLMVHRITSVVEEEGVLVEHSTTFAHVAWWSGLEAEDHGYAVYGWMVIDDLGEPDLATFYPRVLRDFIPYGMSCNAVEEPANLAQPRLFIDPQSGDPHVAAVDLPSCLFQILPLRSVLGEPDELKRRRHVLVFDTSTMIAINPEVPMSSASFEVGHMLSVVMYWDAAEGEALNYAVLEESGWSDVLSLPLGAEIDRARGVDLIRALVH